MARKTSRKDLPDKVTMSVSPPVTLIAALGSLRTTELQRAIRLAAEALGRAAAEVADDFSAAEWEYLAAHVTEDEVPKDASAPGHLLADQFNRASRTFPPPPPEAGRDPAAERLRALGYWQAWAVLVAIKVRTDNAALIEPGVAWWELSTRWRLLTGATEGGKG